MAVELYHGDCIDVMKALESESIDTIITDPPYGLEFMGKDWDHGIPGVAFWKEALRVVKPGAMLLAFGGTRTHHRLMVAIEDAGWEIRDCLMWLYGSGFPKSHNISKAIDKAAGAEREVIGHRPIAYPDSDCWGTPNSGTMDESYIDRNAYGVEKRTQRERTAITAPATPDAQLWDGYGTALKPAWEPIILAMKPLDGTFANNAIEHGVAGLWVDGGRIGMDTSRADRYNGKSPKGGTGYGGYDQLESWKAQPGRFPANLILSHHPDCVEIGTRQVDGNGHWPKTRGGGSQTCGANGHTGQADLEEKHARGETVSVWDCVEDCPVRLLDEQSGVLTSGVFKRRKLRYKGDDGNGWVTIPDDYAVTGCQGGDTGGASRFFYCAKASRSERTCGGEVENKHPTVKPLGLMRYLVRLTKTPTGGTVLDMFAGSGTTPCACIPEGRDCIAIEKERASFEIMEARVKHAQSELQQLQLGV